MRVKGKVFRSYDEVFAQPRLPGWWKWEHTEWYDDGGRHEEVRWWLRKPCGHESLLASPGNPDANGRHHEVEEHADGTISVLPRPENSNSILCRQCGWHGYIRAGVFEQL